jgi:hypothetical protein
LRPPTIISFGNKPYYNKIAKDLHRALKKKYKNFNYLSFDEDNLDEDIKKYAEINPKGFGYWIWKPYLVLKVLEQIDKNDILVYLDARCYFVGERVDWLEDFVNGQYDIGAWRLSQNQLEYQWTSADILDFFDADIEMREQPQFAATIILIRKSKLTKEFMSDWLYIMRKHDYLVRDDNSILSPHKGFIENKHDQSVFSMLLKSVKYRGMSKMIIPYHEMLDTKKSVLIDFRMRPGFMSREIDLLRIHFPLIAKLLRPLYWYFFKVKQDD